MKRYKMGASLMRNVSKMTFMSIVIVLLGAVSIRPAVAQTLYVAGSGSEFGTLDIPTGVFTPIGTTTTTLFGMGFTPSGTLYGLDIQGNAHLYQINPATAASTDLGAINQSVFAATTSNSGTLFAINQDDPGLLYSLDPQSLAITPIGDTGIQAGGLLAFDAAGGLFAGGFDATGDTLYRVDPMNGATTLLGNLGFQVVSGTFVGDTLYGFTSGNEIISINTITGAGTFVSTYNFPNGNIIVAAAVAPILGNTNSIPEPGTCILAVSGLFPLIGLVRHRRWRANRV